MQTSIYLARLIGPALVIVGAGMLFNPQGFLGIATEVIADTGMLYVSAVLGLLGGIAIVLAHNVWAADWRVIITLLGWISIVDSTSWILAARQVARFWAPVLVPATPLIGGAFTLLVGAILCYFGYFAKPSVRGRR